MTWRGFHDRLLATFKGLQQTRAWGLDVGGGPVLPMGGIRPWTVESWVRPDASAMAGTLAELELASDHAVLDGRAVARQLISDCSDSLVESAASADREADMQAAIGRAIAAASPAHQAAAAPTSATAAAAPTSTTGR